MAGKFSLNESNTRKGITGLIKYSSLFFLLLLVRTKLVAQFSSIDSVEIERLYYGMMDANDVNKVELAIARADSLILFCEEKKAWSFAYSLGLYWKIALASVNDRIGILYEGIKEMDAKLILHQKDLGEEGDLLRLNNRVNLGTYFSKIGALNRAKVVFEELLNEVIKNKPEYIGMPTLLMHLSKVHKLQGNYTQALNYILQCQELYNKKKGTESFALGYESLINKHFADIYSLIGKVDLAKQHYEKAIALNKPLEQKDRIMYNGVINNYNAYAKFLQHQNNYPAATQILEESLSLQTKTVSTTEETYRLLAEIQVQLGNYSKANLFFEKSLSVNQYSQKSYLTARTYTAMGKMHLNQEKFQAALDYFQIALQYLHKHFDNQNYCANPSDWTNAWAKRDLLKTLHQKSLALFGLAYTDSKYLQCAWETIRLTISLLDKIKVSNISEIDKQTFIQEIYPIFEDAIRISLAQPNQIGSDFAFEVAEKSKSTLLVSAVRNTQVRDFFVPDSLINLENQYHYKISRLKKLQYENEQKQKNTQPISKKILDLEDRLYSLKQYYQKNFPNYFEIRFNTEVNSVESIQQRLLDQQILVEYFVGPEQIYIFLINKLESIKVLTVDISEQQLNHLIEDFLQAIYAPFSVDKVNTQYNLSKNNAYFSKQKTDSTFAIRGHQLYQLLLEPVLSNTLVPFSKIEIIPDGVLNYLPFDALIQNEVPPKTLGFYENEKDYKFVARDYPISYCYSATLQDLMNKEKIGNKATSGLLIFTDKDFTAQSSTIRRVFEPFSLFNPFVTSLSTHSNKANLKQYSNQYEYLHFSVHGIINNEQPAESHLKLRSDSSGDSLLYLRDLYNLTIPAEMVITSACNAGVGQLSKGEGLLSLARGFAYAGAKSLITTLWTIDGGAADQLLGNFYKNLTQGHSKDVALFEAKKSNLRTAAYAHPYYWASFIPIGNMESIDTPMSKRQLLVASCLILAILVFLLRKFIS